MCIMPDWDLFVKNQLRPLHPTLFPYTTLFRSSCSMSVAVCGEIFSDEQNVTVPAECAAKSNASSMAARDSGPNSDRKSTRLNSSHVKISYAVFWLKKKKAENLVCHRASAGDID